MRVENIQNTCKTGAENVQIMCANMWPSTLSPLSFQVAAEMLNVGVTTLKKRVRDLGIVRWPYRRMCKILSLQSKQDLFIDMVGEDHYRSVVEPAINAALVRPWLCV